jgi:transcriptional regulator with XRE-family HTH domain
MTPKPETPGERLQRVRRSAGLTITELSDKSGVAVGTIWNVENSVGDTQLSTLQKLTKALNINISDLNL